MTPGVSPDAKYFRSVTFSMFTLIELLVLVFRPEDVGRHRIDSAVTRKHNIIGWIHEPVANHTETSPKAQSSKRPMLNLEHGPQIAAMARRVLEDIADRIYRVGNNPGFVVPIWIEARGLPGFVINRLEARIL